MTSIMRLSFLVAFLHSVFSPAAFASQYEISLFRQYFSEFQMANQQYQSASSGSYQEQIANQRRQAAAQSAQNIIRAPNTFQQMSAPENESLLNEFERGYQSAASGSLTESIYNTARRSAAEGLQFNAAAEIQNAYDYNQALQLTLAADRKYQMAASGSLLESVYNQVRGQGFPIALTKFQQFAAYSLQDFRQAESLLMTFEQQYQAAASGSKLEIFYNDGRHLLQNRELELFSAQLTYLSYSELNSIQAEYENKYQRAAPGSLSESLYRSIRDEARARLGGSIPQPQPYPYPQPQPYPPQPQPQYPTQLNTCEVHSGANASGQLLYRVMLRSGAVIATVFTAGEAARIANTDLRCFQ